MQFGNNTNSIPVNEESYIVAKLAIISSMTFLGVSYGLILLLWFFMISDTFLGVWKSIVLFGWDEITAKKFWFGIGTKIAILFVPLSLALTGALAGFDLNIFVLTAMWALIANDLISCYTNLLSIKKRKNYVNKDLVELLINTLRNMIFNGVKRAIEKMGNSEMCDPDKKDESV